MIAVSMIESRRRFAGVAQPRGQGVAVPGELGGELDGGAMVDYAIICGLLCRRFPVNKERLHSALGTIYGSRLMTEPGGSVPGKDHGGDDVSDKRNQWAWQPTGQRNRQGGNK